MKKSRWLLFSLLFVSTELVFAGLIPTKAAKLYEEDYAQIKLALEELEEGLSSKIDLASIYAIEISGLSGGPVYFYEVYPVAKINDTYSELNVVKCGKKTSDSILWKCNFSNKALSFNNGESEQIVWVKDDVELNTAISIIEFLKMEPIYDVAGPECWQVKNERNNQSCKITFSHETLKTIALIRLDLVKKDIYMLGDDPETPFRVYYLTPIDCPEDECGYDIESGEIMY